MKISKRTITYELIKNQEKLFIIAFDQPQENNYPLIPENLISAFKKEQDILEEIITQSSLHKLCTEAIFENTSLKEQMNLINEFSSYLTSKNLSTDLLEYFCPFFSGDFEDELQVGMKPNSFFPITSALELIKNEDLLIKGNNSRLYNNYLKALNSLNEEKENLSHCNDTSFIEKSLKPLEEKIEALKLKYKDVIETIEGNQKVFNEYLSNQNLTNDFNLMKKNKNNTPKLKIKN